MSIISVDISQVTEGFVTEGFVLWCSNEFIKTFKFKKAMGNSDTCFLILSEPGLKQSRERSWGSVQTSFYCYIFTYLKSLLHD